MDPFVNLSGLVVPIDRSNVDTDAIIPKQFMKSIRRTGFGVNLFDEWRYLDRGEPGQDVTNRQLNPDFSLNQKRYQGAQILLTRDNFGCGSSREHAVWALRDYGIRALIAPSYADIFYGNCLKNGILPIALPTETVEALFTEIRPCAGFSLNIDLVSQSVTTQSGAIFHFEIDQLKRQHLIAGADDIALTLQHATQIRAYESIRLKLEPWLFAKAPQ
jgi:3-isopropylmalate/(R)-2-methylmalate dehydratase small subunit